MTAAATPEISSDPKRRLWRLGLVVPFLPLQSILLHEWTGSTLALYLTPVLVFILIPLLDFVRGTDEANLSEELMEEIASSRYYRLLVEAFVPLQLASFALTVVWFHHTSPAFAAGLGMALSVGVVAGIAINAAHEMGHKADRTQQWLARVSLSQSFYGHFYVEHNRGHHRNVATPLDPASSRFNESFYAFVPRTVIGSLVSAWKLEADRLNRRDLGVLSRHNKNLQSWAMSVVLFGVAIAYAGPSIIWFLAVQAVVGFLLLEVVNYLEHYGLLRQQLDSGRYEKCQPHHSWNSNHIVTNLFLYQLQRHSDHHANPTRTYQVLRNFDGVPSLPSGYASMIVLAAIPPLWFRVMNPRVLEIYGGDMSLVHTKPGAAGSLAAA